MAAPSWIGKKLSGRYEIDALLGQGGMSSVYRAEDPNLRRTVAIKMIHPHLSTDPNFVSRFEEEAASIAQLRHPNIIQVYDFSNDEDTYYMVIEFVPGETLETHLKRLEESNRQMAISDAIRYIAHICDALEFAHKRGLIHRDIKPANVMLNPQGEAILMDFGIAKIVGGKQHTATGAVVGTALYMAPEVIKGEQADKRVDIYALGVTLFEILSGHPPFRADSAMSTLMMHVHDPVPDLREINKDVPDALVRVVEKALAKDKDQRFQSAAEFAQALRGIDPNAPKATGATMVDPVPSVYSTMVEDQPAKNTYQQTMVERETPRRTQQQSYTPPPPSEYAGSYSSGMSKEGRKGIPLPLIIGGGIFGIIVLAAILFFGGRLLDFNVSDNADVQLTTEAAIEAFVFATQSSEAMPTDTQVPVAIVDPTEQVLPTDTLAPTFTPTPTNPPEPYVRINSIRLNGSAYIVEYETFGYTEVLPGEHVHFFFNTVAPEDAGVGGAGPWYVWGGPRPFDKYTTNDRPASATQMCALYAYPNHTIQLSTGNCVDLPSE